MLIRKCVLFLIYFLSFYSGILAQTESKTVWDNFDQAAINAYLIDIEYSSDGKQVIAFFNDSIRIFDIEKERVIHSFVAAPNSRYRGDRNIQGKKLIFQHKNNPFITYFERDTVIQKNKSKEEYQNYYFLYSIVTRNFKTGQTIDRVFLDTLSYYQNEVSTFQGFDYKLTFLRENLSIAVYNDFGTYTIYDYNINEKKVKKHERDWKFSDFILLEDKSLLFSQNDSLVNISGNKFIRSFKSDSINQLFRIDQERIITEKDGQISIYRLNEELELITSFHLGKGKLKNIYVNHKNNFTYNFAFSDLAKSLSLIDSNGNSFGELIIENNDILISAFHPKENSILLFSNNERLISYNLDHTENSPIPVPQLGHLGTIDHIAFSDDQKYMVTRSSDAMIIWDVRYKKSIYKYELNYPGDVRFDENSHDLLYTISSTQYRLKWRNWINNYTESLKLRANSNSNEDDYLIPEVKVLKNWAKNLSDYEIDDYGQNLDESNRYRAGILRNKKTYQSEIVIESKNNKKIMTLKSDSLLQGYDAINFVNDSILAVASLYNIVLINIPQDKIIGEFYTRQKRQNVNKIFSMDEDIYSFSDNHFSKFNFEEGKLIDRYSDEKSFSGGSDLMDYTSQYTTFPIYTTDVTFQFIKNNTDNFTYVLMTGEFDTIVRQDNAVAQMINLPGFQVFKAKLVPGTTKVALLLINNLIEHYTNGAKTKSYFIVLDYVTQKIDYKFDIPEVISIPNIQISHGGEKVAIWDIGENSEVLRKELENVPGVKDLDNFDQIIILNLENYSQTTISITKLDIKRLNQGIMFVPNNPNELIIHDDYSGVMNYVDLVKKKVIRRVSESSPNYPSKGNIQGPFFSSTTGDSLYYAIGYSQDGRDHNRFKAVNLKTDKIILDYAFQDKIRSACLSNDQKYLILGHLYDAITMYNLQEKIVIGKFVNDKTSQLFVAPDGYYRTSSTAINDLFFRVNGELFPFEQFDLKYNRPDIIIDRLGYANKNNIEAYKNAYLKRLQKMGFKEEMLQADFHVPEISIDNSSSIPSATEDSILLLNLSFKDTRYKLDRIIIWVNGVPIMGLKGINLRDLDLYETKRQIPINLSTGINKIQISVLNQAGAESYKETVLITYNNPKPRQNLYFIGIGVRNYIDASMNLKYSDKDIRDIAKIYSENKNYSNLFIDTFINENVTTSILPIIRKRLANTTIHDQVILMYSGHGVLDSTLNYYLTTHNINFTNPAEKGILYEDFNALLDGIPARKKLMLIDACHSGEVDKEETAIELKSINGVQATELGKGDLFKQLKSTGNSFDLMQEVFSDLRRGNGSTVISSSAGKYYSYEDKQFKNGVYTYALKLALSGAADTNSNREITVNELKNYLQQKVSELTNGKQKPTTRQENLEIDWRIW